MFQCIKYSYTNGTPRKRQIKVSEDEILYCKTTTTWSCNTVININSVKGVTYGPRTTTFNMVKECIPWLIISIITANRTYDLEFKTLNSLKHFISFLVAFNDKSGNTMTLPQIEHIEMDRIWMQQHNNAAVLKIFKNPKWNSWSNNRNRKYRIIKSRNRNKKKILHEDNDNNCCCICTDEYDDTDFVCQLICDHIFHISCIAQWFEQSFTCPLCRVSIS
jgi:hypothetical protein